jgi:ABC-type dipeptide/oligopeptide/nickel transport system permease component
MFAGGVTFALGIGCAIAGVRRGSRASRAASAICLVVLALPVIGVAIACVLLAVYGMPRLG